MPISGSDHRASSEAAFGRWGARCTRGGGVEASVLDFEELPLVLWA